jgi:ATP adenylyltransferase
MKHLWSPWRSTYIDTFGSAEQDHGCFLCAAAMNSSSDPLVIAESEHCFVIMNRYPYNAGHVLISPKRHCPDTLELTDEEYHDIMQLTRIMQIVLKNVYSPHGFNIGMNIGESGGAGVPGHLHIHIVPRWSGDTNFMTSIGDAKVISSSMEKIVQELRAGYQSYQKRMCSEDIPTGSAL